MVLFVHQLSLKRENMPQQGAVLLIAVFVSLLATTMLTGLLILGRELLTFEVKSTAAQAATQAVMIEVRKEMAALAAARIAKAKIADGDQQVLQWLTADDRNYLINDPFFVSRLQATLRKVEQEHNLEIGELKLRYPAKPIDINCAGGRELVVSADVILQPPTVNAGTVLLAKNFNSAVSSIPLCP